MPTTTPDPKGLFSDVFCAVDGSRGSSEGVRQAIELAQPDGRVTFVCVTDVRGVGANRVANVGEHRAEMALAGAKALARDRGLHCETELVHAAATVDEILARQGDHELLVIGSHPETRLGGIMIGSTATALTHRTEGLLLVARPSASPVPFPQRMVVATDAGSEQDPVVDTAVRLAVARDAHVDIVHATRRHPDVRARGPLGALAAFIWSQTKREPLVTEEPGDPAALVAKVVERDDANILVVGHGGRKGLCALGSVSEQLVHRAACSVLLVPTAAGS